MGFFASGSAKGKTVNRGPSVEFLHKMECKACSLHNTKCNSPKMAPSGGTKAQVYVLGEFPTWKEDQAGRHLPGLPGRIFRDQVPEAYRGGIRYNNVIRTSTGLLDPLPTPLQIECCRPSVVRDIEEIQPRVIIGLGETALKWATGQNFIHNWRGRKVPVKIGQHRCWFYPMVSPYWLADRRGDGWAYNDGGWGMELEHAFRLDMRRLFADLPYLLAPDVHDAARAEEGVVTYSGHEAGDLSAVGDMLQDMAKEPLVGVDYETNQLKPFWDHSKIMSAAVSNLDTSVAFAFDHPGAGWSPDQKKKLRQMWRGFLMAKKVRKTVHNLAFELMWSGVFFGIDTIRGGLWEDSSAQAFTLDERVGGRKPGCMSLQFLGVQYFGLNIKELSPLSRDRLADEPIDDVLRYNAIDAKYHIGLYLEQEKELKRKRMMTAYRIMHRRVATTTLTQLKGVPVDQPTVRELDKEFLGKIEMTRSKILELDCVQDYRTLAGHNFDPGNNVNVLFMLQKVLQSDDCVDDDGKLSTDEEVLAKIDHPISPLIIELRRFSKMHSTYVLPLKEGSPVLYPDGMLHAVFNTTQTETGRLACEDPNMQNFPKYKNKEVRRSVKARPGYILFSADYGQIEARVAAMFSRDKRFVDALWKRYDIHQEWAERIASDYPSRIGGRPFLKDKDVMKSLRQEVKNKWVFPLIFGSTVKSVARDMKIPKDVAQKLYNDFWEHFEGIHTWQKKVDKSFYKNGYVEMLTGRRRHAPLTPNQLYNTPIQGTACDIVVDGMDRLSEKDIMELQANMQIHDDLTYELLESTWEQNAEIIINEMLSMSHFDFINVPITIEVSLGKDWASMKEIEKFSSDEWFAGK